MCLLQFSICALVTIISLQFRHNFSPPGNFPRIHSISSLMHSSFWKHFEFVINVGADMGIVWQPLYTLFLNVVSIFLKYFNDATNLFEHKQLIIVFMLTFK